MSYSTRHRSHPLRERGFTFIEVLVAMLIFTLAVLAAVNIGNGSVRATREAKEISAATWLLQSKMTEVETRLESEGVDKACEKKKDGKFEAPNEKFSYTVTCLEIDFNLSETAAAMTGQSGDDEDSKSKEDQITKMILQTASAYFSKSLREIHVEVKWLQGKTPRTIAATTHFVRYDLPLEIPGLGGAGGTGSSGSTPGTGTTPTGTGGPT